MPGGNQLTQSCLLHLYFRYNRCACTFSTLYGNKHESFCFKKRMYNMCVFLGLPKPAIVNNSKAISCSLYWQTFGYNENDIGYAVTPLYHSASTNLCLFNTIERGTDLRFNHILWYISCHWKLHWWPTCTYVLLSVLPIPSHSVNNSEKYCMCKGRTISQWKILELIWISSLLLRI